jgi:phosphoribosyl-AMP cyclohydrolase
MTDAAGDPRPAGDGETQDAADVDETSGSDRAHEAAVVDWGEDGLVPAVAQDVDTGEVLMLAYVDREALAHTRETGLAHYHSRSRDELWRKGQSSGHVQRVDAVRVDCDGDALLYRVHQEGGACHTGFRSCFHRDPDGDAVGERVFDPDEVYDGEE